MSTSGLCIGRKERQVSKGLPLKYLFIKGSETEYRVLINPRKYVKIVFSFLRRNLSAVEGKENNILAKNLFVISKAPATVLL